MNLHRHSKEWKEVNVTAVAFSNRYDAATVIVNRKNKCKWLLGGKALMA